MITKFKIFEKVNLDYVMDNPDCDSDECEAIRQMYNYLKDIKRIIDNKNIFDINDITYFDQYQGAYGIVSIFNRKYKVWSIEENYPDNYLWIDAFPIDNTSIEGNGQLPGFKGGVIDIADLLFDIKEHGGVEEYKNVKKYNL